MELNYLLKSVTLCATSSTKNKNLSPLLEPMRPRLYSKLNDKQEVNRNRNRIESRQTKLSLLTTYPQMRPQKWRRLHGNS